MKRTRYLVWTLLVLLSAGALSGCFQSLVLVKVNKDGSGTLEETMVLTESFSQLLAKMSGQEAPSQDKQKNDVDEQRLQEKARAMGEGVRLVSAEPVKNEKGSGYRAVFSFPDINKVRVNQNPGAGIAAGPGAEEESQSQSPEEWLQFRFTPGSTSTLQVLYPTPTEGEQETQKEEEPQQDMGENPEMMQMMRQLYSDMRISITLEVAGRIVDTNARYVDGSRVTLMDVDFGKLLEDETRFQQLLNANPKSIEEIEQITGDNPALRLDTQQEISIRFR
jgi:hypothetical protein